MSGRRSDRESKAPERLAPETWSSHGRTKKGQSSQRAASKQAAAQNATIVKAANAAMASFLPHFKTLEKHDDVPKGEEPATVRWRDNGQWN
jgi:hypothetical protein